MAETSAHPAKAKSEKAIKGMLKRITIPPDGRFESTKPAITTISIGLSTALSAASFFNFIVVHANAGPMTGTALLS